MRISLFTHDANLRVDSPLCRKSKSYIAALLAAGQAVMLSKWSAQLCAPPPELTNWRDVMRAPAIVAGRNSCRKVGEAGDASYRVDHFSYPVPACGARHRTLSVRLTNLPFQAVEA
jgi:hypothetical protein